MAKVERTEPGSKNDWRITYDTGSQKWTDDRPGDGVGESGPDMMKETMKDPAVKRGLNSISDAVKSGKGIEDAVKGLIRDIGKEKAKTLVNKGYEDSDKSEGWKKAKDYVDSLPKQANVKDVVTVWAGDRKASMVISGNRRGYTLRFADIRQEVNLRSEYNNFNNKYFGGELPTVALKWNKSRRAGGIASARINRITGEITPISIKISTFLKMDKDRFDKIMIHEMIHIWQFHNNINERERGGHGRTFLQKAREVGSKAGIIIPLTEDISGMEISDDVKATTYIAVLWGSRPKMSLFSRPTFDRHRTEIERYFESMDGKDGEAQFYSTAAKELMKYKAMRQFDWRMRYYGSVPAELIEEIRKNGTLIGETKKDVITPEMMNFYRLLNGFAKFMVKSLNRRYEPAQFTSDVSIDGKKVVCQIIPKNGNATGLIQIQVVPPDDVGVFLMRNTSFAFKVKAMRKLPTPATVMAMIDDVEKKEPPAELERAWGIPISAITASNRVASRFMMAADWSRAFRQDYSEPEPMSGSDLRKVKSVTLKKNPERRTWWMVYDRQGNYLGQVRTKVGGEQEYMVADSKQRVYAGETRNSGDPDHAYAILALLEEI